MSCDWKVGDYVTCIEEAAPLILNKEYLVVEQDNNLTYVHAKDTDYDYGFFNWRFKKSLKTPRKLKLKKLYES